MTKTEAKKKLDGCIRRAMELSETTQILWDTQLIEDLKADSLELVMLGFEMEEAFGISSDDLIDAFDHDITPREIIKFLMPKLEEKEVEDSFDDDPKRDDIPLAILEDDELRPKADAIMDAMDKDRAMEGGEK